MNIILSRRFRFIVWLSNWRAMWHWMPHKSVYRSGSLVYRSWLCFSLVDDDAKPADAHRGDG